ncbi:MAG: phosphoglycerate dehydrogenase [Casimicrobiaceae bacterium]
MRRYRVLTLNHIAPRGLARLPERSYEVGSSVAEPDAIVLRSAELDIGAVPASVKAVGRAGAGTNNIPVFELSRRGVPVFNAPGANANAVCELVLAALLMGARQLVAATRFVEGLQADPGEYMARVESGKRAYSGVEIAGRTLGVVGLGAVGALVAHTAAALGMQVVGYDPETSADPSRRLPTRLQRVSTLDELLRRADFITLHVPLLPATRYLIDARQLAICRDGAILLNFARDEIVDPIAVLAAVRAARLGAYLCDFPDPRFRGERNIVALPHLGASTAEAEENCAVMVVDQVRDFLEEGTIRNAVNFPAVDMPRESPHRLAIANANVPNMLGQISSTVACAGLNIHDMVNRSRGEMAYTLVDLDSAIPVEVITTLAGIHGVLSVRAVPQLPDLAAT